MLPQVIRGKRKPIWTQATNPDAINSKISTVLSLNEENESKFFSRKKYHCHLMTSVWYTDLKGGTYTVIF